MPPDIDAGEVHDRVDAVEHGGQVARRDVDPVELEAPHPPGRLAHVETDDALDPVASRRGAAAAAGARTPATPVTAIDRWEHVHRLIG